MIISSRHNLSLVWSQMLTGVRSSLSKCNSMGPRQAVEHSGATAAGPLAPRAGWLATPDMLLYVPIGLTQSHYDWDGAYSSYSNKDTKTFSADKSGFFAGFGVENDAHRPLGRAGRISLRLA
jgi:opacity protein-like surface antigen